MTTFDEFIAPSEVRIDPKNRLPLGAALKKDGADSGEAKILTIGFDGCLYFMPAAEWDDLMAKLEAKGSTNEHALQFRRTMTYNASKVKPDSQYRIVVPQRLMDLAGFSAENREACLLWVGTRLEVWEKSRFDSYMSGEPYKLDPKVQTLKKAAGDLTL